MSVLTLCGLMSLAIYFVICWCYISYLISASISQFSLVYNSNFWQVCDYLLLLLSIIHLQIIPSWKRKISCAMAVCDQSEELWGPDDWCAFGKACILSRKVGLISYLFSPNHLDLLVTLHPLVCFHVSPSIVCTKWIFHLLQRYSGGDLLGVTAKVIDMPHHCMCSFLWNSF